MVIGANGGTRLLTGCCTCCTVLGLGGGGTLAGGTLTGIGLTGGGCLTGGPVLACTVAS